MEIGENGSARFDAFYPGQRVITLKWLGCGR
jgi:hypothetical protein